MVQISQLAKNVRFGDDTPTNLSKSNTDTQSNGSQIGVSSLAGQPTMADRLLGMSQDAYLAQSQAANEQQTTQHLLSDINATIQNNPEGFKQAMHAAYGGKASFADIDALADKALSGDLPLPANIKFVDASALGNGSLGAYDSKVGGTVYLNRSLIGNPDLLKAVFTEELGHHLDTVLGGEDAAGDEGEIFSQSLLKASLSVERIQQLKSENDAGFITVNGQRIGVEFHGGLGEENPVETVSPEATPTPTPTPSPGTGNSDSDNDKKTKKPITRPAATPVPVVPAPTQAPQTPQTQNTSDGPAGGDPDEFEKLTGIPSPTPTPTPQTQNTSDGPAGGDPDEFEKLTGIPSDWSAPPDEDNNEEDKSGAGAAGVGVVGLGIREFLKRAGLSFLRVISGTATVVLGAGSSAVGAGLAAIGMHGNVGDEPTRHTINGTNLTIVVQPGSLEGTVYKDGVPTLVQVIGVEVEGGVITSFRPADELDAHDLGGLLATDVNSETVLNTVLLNENTESSDDTDSSETTPGTRRKNRLPPRGEPNTIAENEPGTTRKKYGPDGHPVKEWNKGHTGESTPEIEQSDHIHDYYPNPHHPEGKPIRGKARKPTEQDLIDMGLKP